MVDTASHRSAEVVSDWRSAGLAYHAYSYHLRQRFGARVQKVSLDGGFTCPNVDGTVAIGGCVFCDNRSFSPSRRIPRVREIGEQLRRGIGALKRRYRVDRFLAYFQPATNTYAPVERLRALYDEALSHPQVVGLVVGTRPDCVPEPVLELLADYGRRTYVCVEYGLQTIHDRSLDWMNRGHDYACFVDAIERSAGRGFEIAAHVILGLPGESREDMLATARAVAGLPIDAVKIHNLYVVAGTLLEEMYRRGDARMLELERYVALVADFLERLPPHVVIQRISGEVPAKYLVAPSWCLDKPAVRSAVARELCRRGSVQGCQCPRGG